MAAAFTAARARSAISLLVLLFLACGKPTELRVSAIDPKISQANGRMWFNGEAFTGMLYALGALQTDTLAIQHYRNSFPDGRWEMRYPDGKLKERRYFKNGRKAGFCEDWWPNGKPQRLCAFVNGEYHGRLRVWNAHGRLVVDQHYRHGYESGSQRLYYDNGKVRANYIVQNGRRYGLLGTKNCVNASEKLLP